jgi:hypothetical protein
MAGREVESSDTNPALDPSEQSKVSKREDSGSDMSGQSGSSTSECLQTGCHGTGCIVQLHVWWAGRE